MSARESKIQLAQTIIGYSFQDPDLLWEALQVAGSGQSRIRGRNTSKGNERLAVLGDVRMASVLCEEWFTGPTDKGTS